MLSLFLKTKIPIIKEKIFLGLTYDETQEIINGEDKYIFKHEYEKAADLNFCPTIIFTSRNDTLPPGLTVYDKTKKEQVCILNFPGFSIRKFRENDMFYVSENIMYEMAGYRSSITFFSLWTKSLIEKRFEQIIERCDYGKK